MTFLRSLITVVLLLLFVGLWFWAFSKKRRDDFDAAARLPLEDDDRPAPERQQGDR